MHDVSTLLIESCPADGAGQGFADEVGPRVIADRVVDSEKF